tara:strand:+ start:572 stop:1813 length:1242 start_codon:yes stop_codon:yes gene_type:complete
MNITLFTPYELQRKFIQSFSDTDDLFGVISAPRGSGKTLLGINILLYWLLQQSNRKGGWIAPVYSQSKSVMDTIVNTSKDVIESSNRMEGTINFINGSTIKFLSSDSPDNIRGFRFTHLILDECAFLKENALNTAILPTLNPNGKKCLMISTPKGKNFFFNWFNKKDTVSMSFPLTQCPYVSKTLIEEARKSLPPDIFRQEFLAEFVDSGNDVFIGVEKVSTVGVFSCEKKVDAYIGIDTGLTDDYSVLTMISPTGRVLWVETLNNMTLQEIASRFKNIMSNFNVVGGYIECNGVGKAMADQIIPLYRNVKEFFMTQDRKQDLVRKLISDIESMTIELPTRDLLPELHNEFSTYTYKLSPAGKLSFSHIPGAKDDHVDSLLLANYSRVKFLERKPVSIRTSRKNLKPRFGSIS